MSSGLVSLATLLVLIRSTLNLAFLLLSTLRRRKMALRFCPVVLVALGLLAGRAAGAAPSVVYVDSTYGTTSASVTFPNSGGSGPYQVGVNAFKTIQAGVDHVADLGTVYVAAGTYAETNLTIQTRLSLLGPNAGKAGNDPTRGAEARVIPGVNDPYDTGIISVETNSIVIDGFLLDGNNPALGAGLPGNGAQLYAAAGVQNGVVDSYLADVSQLRVQNNIIRNVSYDGVYLDRFDYPTTSSAGNYVVSNQFENMWEGVSTYNLHSVIAYNTFTNLNHGISVHGTVNAAPGFTPLIASNTLTIAQWWPSTPEGDVSRAPGIWVNYRKQQAPRLDVIGNVINTPLAPPPGKTIIGLWAMTADETNQVNFINNTVNGAGICTEGFYAIMCTGDNVKLLGGSLNGIAQVGVLADTVDPNYGNGDALVTVSNVTITVSSASAVGVLAVQETSAPGNKAQVTVIGNTSISGGLAGVQVQGTNAAAIVRNNTASITGNSVGIDVDAGKALIENNNLTGNSTAGIRVSNNGIVDAGDCHSANLTGLGSSAGLNNLSGYGFDGFAPWAIQNLGGVTVLAQNNTYGATANDTLAGAVFGAVSFSQAGGTPLICPPALVVQTLNLVPAPAATVAAFQASDGLVADTSGTLSSSDTIVTNSVGHYLVTRTYSLTDICGQTTSCQQSIAVLPLISFLGPSAGHPTLSINGQPGHLYSIQASTDFVHWVNLVTNAAQFSFVDTSSTAFPYRFYRAQILP